MKSGRLKVDGNSVMKGTANFLVEADSVGQFEFSVVEFGPTSTHITQLTAVTTLVSPSTSEHTPESAVGCLVINTFNVSLQTLDNLLSLKFMTLQSDQENCHKTESSLSPLWISLIALGVVALLSVVIGGVLCWKNRHKHWASKALKEYMDEGYDEASQPEELVTFLVK